MTNRFIICFSKIFSFRRNDKLNNLKEKDRCSLPSNRMKQIHAWRKRTVRRTRTRSNFECIPRPFLGRREREESFDLQQNVKQDRNGEISRGSKRKGMDDFRIKGEWQGKSTKSKAVEINQYWTTADKRNLFSILSMHRFPKSTTIK